LVGATNRSCACCAVIESLVFLFVANDWFYSFQLKKKTKGA
jgi:hypothetical protein